MSTASAAPSQLSPHGATRVDLPGRYGPIAALRIPPSTGPSTPPMAGAQTSDPAAIALLLPGFTGSKEDFAPLLDRIADAGIEPIAIDLPGQYESPGPDSPDDEDAYLPESLGQVIAELIGKLAADGRPVLVLGHSYGGLVARGAVLAGASIVGLTLMDSGPGELPAGRQRSTLDLGEPYLREHGVEAAQLLREQLDAGDPAWMGKPEELRDFFRERFVRSTAAGLLGMSRGLRGEPDRVAKLARAMRSLKAPCLVVCGVADDAWPVAAQRDMAERLDADFAVVANAGHAPNTENPDELLATLLPTWHTWLR
ncbi:MAG TPA: alpha/beta fold hydrolase [Pseudonocardiaceae bacterium]|nr:alpha/beta fold hydrolase [Pseudonocardiaceae bacterium]